MTLIVFGVTGAGKTSIGQRLARQLGWTFHDADDFHSPANVEKMRRGVPLTDDDRWPWLDRLRQLIADAQGRGEQVVLACSALKRTYRERLAAGLEVTFVYLEADRTVIAARLRQRENHFMNPELLTSQFEALEQPASSENVVVVNAADTPDAIVQHIRAAVQR